MSSFADKIGPFGQVRQTAIEKETDMREYKERRTNIYTKN